MFKFSGKRPRDLGVRNGRFTAATTWKPNWVSSQIASSEKHYETPLSCSGGVERAMQKLKGVIEAQPGAVLIESTPDYLYAEFSTPLMGFTDDVEFFCDGKVIHVRSASRLGIRDFGVNRRRVETLRAALGS